MSYETFTGRSVDEAKQQMRATLGSNAVILSTKRLADGLIELRAIQKGQPLFKGEAPGYSAPPQASNGRGGLSNLASRSKGGGQHQPTQQAPQGAGLHNRVERSVSDGALSNLKGDISGKLAGGSGDVEELSRSIGRHGLSTKMLRALSSELRGNYHPGDPATLQYALDGILNFAPLHMSPDAPIMLCGQTGAGKTSSAAKLAARAAASGQRVSFMSADVGRAGAMDQMRTYADALDTRFWPVEDPADVRDIMRTERPRDIIVLDTPGVSPFAPADMAAMQSFRDSIGAEPILVLPASGDMEEHKDWAMAFREIGTRRCIITKFDTSRRIGAAVSAAFESGLALAHFSEAPFISEGLIDANAEYLAHRLLISEPARLGG